MKDYVSGNDLITNGSVSLSYDRYSRPNSALSLTGVGFYSLPPGTYFSGDFTLVAWIYINSFGLNDRLIDCGNGIDSDNVIISYNQGTTFEPYVSIVTNSTFKSGNLVANLTMSINVWNHIAVTLAGNSAFMYLNGSIIGAWNSNSIPRNVYRSSCYFGRSNYPGDSLSNAKFDAIKIYNRALSSYEIWNDFLSLM